MRRRRCSSTYVPFPRSRGARGRRGAAAQVRRDPAAIVRSHEARGETAFTNLAMGLEDAVASRVAWAEWQRARWCGPKVSFSLHALKHAAHANKFKKLRVG